MNFRLFGTKTFFALPFGFAVEASCIPAGGVGFIASASYIKRDRLKGLIVISFNLSLLGRAFLTRHIDKVMAQIFIGHHPVRVPPSKARLG